MDVLGFSGVLKRAVRPRLTSCLGVVAAVAACSVLAAAPASASWLDQSTPVVTGATEWGFSAVSCVSLTWCMAVGSSDASSSGLLAEIRDTDHWTQVTIPDPGGANLSSISCTSTSACTAVGDFTSGSTTVPLAETWNGAGWAVQTTPSPAGVASSELSRVSCRSGSDCVAVGGSITGTTTATLAEAWNGSGWTIQSTPNAAGEANNQLSGLSCVSATHCTAVGYSANGTDTVPLAELWNGTSWAVQTVPAPSGSYHPLAGVSCTSAAACVAVGDGFAEGWNGTSWAAQTIAKAKANLSSVSCESATVCAAVGGIYSQGIQYMIAESWNGTSWKVENTPISTSYDTDVLTDISCANLTTCTAVGTYHDPVDGDRALVEIMQLRWHPAVAAVASGAIATGLDTLSCTSLNSCMAVGDYEASSSTFDSLAESWNGGSWTVLSTPNAANSNLSGVSCTAVSACTAVGDAVSGSDLVPLAERWNGTSWTVQATPSPAGAGRSYLSSVSCESATACTAVGFSVNGSGDQVTLAETWNGTSWAIDPTPNPGGTSTVQLNGVSCVSANACTAVGYSLTPSYTMLAESWNGTSWQLDSTPVPSGGTISLLNGVSCVSAGSCTAVGNYDNGTVSSALAEHWNGTAWSAQTIPNQIGATATYLSSVACASNGACTAVGSGTHGGASTLETLGEHWNGTAWSLTAAPGIPPGALSGNLTSVSCVSGNGCIAAGYYYDSSNTELPLYAPYN